MVVGEGHGQITPTSWAWGGAAVVGYGPGVTAVATEADGWTGRSKADCRMACICGDMVANTCVGHQ